MPNGIIINYIVTYYNINDNTTVISTTLQLTTLQLTSLTPFTNYTISVQASTTAGIGEFSNITVQTFEDGKRTFIDIDLKSIYIHISVEY